MIGENVKGVRCPVPLPPFQPHFHARSEVLTRLSRHKKHNATRVSDHHVSTQKSKHLEQDSSLLAVYCWHFWPDGSRGAIPP